MQLHYVLIIQYDLKCYNNNAIINNNYGRLENISCFKVPTGTRKNFLKIYR